MFIFLFSLYLIYILFYISSLPTFQSEYSFCTAVNSLSSYIQLQLLHIPTLPACNVSSVGPNQISLRNTIKNWRHKQRSGQHTLACQKICKNFFRKSVMVLSKHKNAQSCAHCFGWSPFHRSINRQHILTRQTDRQTNIHTVQWHTGANTRFLHVSKSQQLTYYLLYR